MNWSRDLNPRLSVNFPLLIWIFMEGEGDEIKSKQDSKRDRTLVKSDAAWPTQVPAYLEIVHHMWMLPKGNSMYLEKGKLSTGLGEIILIFVPRTLICTWWFIWTVENFCPWFFFLSKSSMGTALKKQKGWGILLEIFRLTQFPLLRERKKKIIGTLLSSL